MQLPLLIRSPPDENPIPVIVQNPLGQESDIGLLQDYNNHVDNEKLNETRNSLQEQTIPISEVYPKDLREEGEPAFITEVDSGIVKIQVKPFSIKGKRGAIGIFFRKGDNPEALFGIATAPTKYETTAKNYGSEETHDEYEKAILKQLDKKQKKSDIEYFPRIIDSTIKNNDNEYISASSRVTLNTALESLAVAREDFPLYERQIAALLLIQRASSALKQLHSLGFAHRDAHTLNFQVSENLGVNIVDFRKSREFPSLHPAKMIKDISRIQNNAKQFDSESKFNIFRYLHSVINTPRIWKQIDNKQLSSSIQRENLSQLFLPITGFDKTKQIDPRNAIASLSQKHGINLNDPNQEKQIADKFSLSLISYALKNATGNSNYTKQQLEHVHSAITSALIDSPTILLQDLDQEIVSKGDQQS